MNMRLGHVLLIFGVLLVGICPGVPQPAIVIQPADQAVWTGGSVSFSFGVSGNGPFTYQWQLNGLSLLREGQNDQGDCCCWLRLVPRNTRASYDARAYSSAG